MLIFIGTAPSSSAIPRYQPYRTGYHFQPAKNWINDPTGPVLFKGTYHLFYQFNTHGTVWGPPVWAHSTSKDLLNWDSQPIAIGPQIVANLNGSWSGSTTILHGNRPVILFTGLDPNRIQSQILAVPKNLSDPYLKEWILVRENPVISPLPKYHINASAFRDPSEAWTVPDGSWRVVVGSLRDQRGLALFFRSKDFLHWNLVKHPLFSAKDTGVWECPDFFPVYANCSSFGVDTSTFGLDVKHILKISLDALKRDVYSIGTYNISEDSYTPDMGFDQHSGWRYDYGSYYASKTFYDGAMRRRVLLGWVKESSSPKADERKGWSGIHAIPRRVWLDRSGKQLIQWPISSIENLRRKAVSFGKTVIRGGGIVEVSGVTAAQADVSLSFRVKNLKNVDKFDGNWTDPQMVCGKKGASVKGQIGPFGLLALASKGLEEHTAVFFRVFRGLDQKLVVLMCSDQKRSSLARSSTKSTYGTFLNLSTAHEELSLRTLIDHSVVESFGGRGRSVITARAYPVLAVFDGTHLFVFNNGTEDVQLTGLKAWSLKKARVA